MKGLNYVLKPTFYLPIVYLIVGWFSFIVIKKIIKTLFLKQRKATIKNNKRYNTLIQVTLDCIKIVIIVLVILSILSVYGVNVKTALAGLGIISALIGLAFQDLFKDIIVGFSIIVEDYFSVGDTIEVNGFKGEVLHIGIKSTKIKRFDGPIMILANRNIDNVINYSVTYSMAIVDIGVAYECDIDKVMVLLTDLFKKLSKSIKELKGDIEIWGVEDLASSSVNIRVAAKTETMKHFDVQRIIRKEVKDLFDKNNIKIPYPQLEVHNG